jgi:hypothetical protein
MFEIQFLHKINPDGSVGLEYYRYAHDVTGEIAAELVDGKIIWYRDLTALEPDFTKDIVELRLEDIMHPWFLERHGIISTFQCPVTDMEAYFNET